MESNKPKLSRRSFLLAAGAGGVATAAAVATRVIPADKPAGAATGGTDRKGYHVSEHIRNYYRTTRV